MDNKGEIAPELYFNVAERKLYERGGHLRRMELMGEFMRLSQDITVHKNDQGAGCSDDLTARLCLEFMKQMGDGVDWRFRVMKNGSGGHDVFMRICNVRPGTNDELAVIECPCPLKDAKSRVRSFFDFKPSGENEITIELNVVKTAPGIDAALIKKILIEAVTKVALTKLGEEKLADDLASADLRAIVDADLKHDALLKNIAVGDRVKIKCEGRTGLIKSIDANNGICTLAVDDATGKRNLKYRMEDITK